jgi:hypothetical protein
MKSGIWSPSKKNVCALNEKTMGGTKKWNFERGSEVKKLCITDKTSKDTFKKQATYLKGDSTVFK